MAYATSNPPFLMVPSVDSSKPQIWGYTTTDASATVDGSGYITNGGNLGMRVNDLVLVFDTNTPLVTGHQVITVSSTAPGAVDLSNGTTVGLNTNSD